MNTPTSPTTKPDRNGPSKPEREPDIAEEAGPKSTEFGTEEDAKEITQGDFDKIP